MEFSKSDINQFRRKSTVNRAQNEKINNLKQSITTIEDFSNEFFYQIFNYLDGCDIYHAFANLNHRFQELLNSSSVLFKINLSNWLSRKILRDIYKQMIIFNKHQIFSINSSTSLSTNRFCSSFSVDPSFTRLESIVLYESQSDIFISFLKNLSCLPRLFSLTLKMFKNVTNLTDVYEITLELPMLKYHNVLTDPSNFLVSLPINTDQQFSCITHLVIKNHCSFNNVLSIISYTPQLYHLNYRNTNSTDTNIEINSPIKLSNLKYLFIRVYNTKFDIFEMFLRKIDSKLKVLSFTTRHEDTAYLDANRWKEIILKYLFQLEKFYLKYYQSCRKGSKTQLYSGKKNQFTSSFWIKRQWVFEVQRYFESIMYSIRPYKKRWDEFIEDEMGDFSSKLCKLTELIFIDMHPNEWRDIINVDIKRILSITQICHLTISFEKVFIGVLIPILNSLPNLYSLKMHSLSFSDPEDMNHEDYDIFFSTEPTNKVFKIYLEKMDKINELYFLRRLCPYAVYLKVDWIEGKVNTVPFLHVYFE